MSAPVQEKQVARVIVLHGNKVLLVEKKSMPGLLELPGGQKKAKEGFKAAALRELHEETSLAVAAKQLRRWGHGRLITTHDTGICVATTVYLLILDQKRASGVRPRREIVRCQWLTLPKLLRNPRVERKSGLILRLMYVFS